MAGRARLVRRRRRDLGALLFAVMVIAQRGDARRDPDPAARPEHARPPSTPCCTSWAATRSCWRCTRSPASPASSPAARCRWRPSATRGFWRVVHDRAGPLAIAFVVAATTFSLVTQAYVLGDAAATLAAQGGMHPVLLIVGILRARRPRADRALPAARGVDRRQPPQGLARAARGDVRDGRDRRPDPRRGRLRRGLPQPAPDPGASRIAAPTHYTLYSGSSGSQGEHMNDVTDTNFQAEVV